MAEIIEHFVGGKRWSGSSSRRSTVWNPALGTASAEVVLANAADVDHVVGLARGAFEGWGQSSLSSRTKILFGFREILNSKIDLLAEAITDEHGKVLSDARGEIQRGLEVVEFACGIPQLLKGDFSKQVSTGVDLFSFREPLGVTAGITPFNFPAMVPLWMFPIAIACGNCFILKPSERDPSASLMLAEIWSEAGLPDGVFSVVQGDKEAVDALLDHPGIDAISFVGSTPIARYIHERASAQNKRVQALGGAKNHAVILPDADIDFALQQLSSAAFGSAGERCMAISTTVTVGGGSVEIAQELSRQAASITVGSGRESGVEMGPVVTAASKTRIESLITSAEEDGATINADGRGLVVPGFEQGFFVGPTVISKVGAHMDVYREEIFGPVLTLMEAGSLEDAVRVINANPYGNGTAIFTSSGEAARYFQSRVQVGMIGINVPIPVPMAFYSFGGWKSSLFGEHHIHGPEGVAFYTRGKVVTSRWPSLGSEAKATYHFPTAQ
jgi:malonate-semialdehyde dehydrogenase (acetylating)/methylmalonate-semialdehyde dehydrogenase